MQGQRCHGDKVNVHACMLDLHVCVYLLQPAGYTFCCFVTELVSQGTV